jgi:hypothetical protein
MIKNRLILLIVTFAFASQAWAQQSTYDGTNKDGSVVTAIFTAGYDPRPADPNRAPIYPFPFNLLFLGTTDHAEPARGEPRELR